jgi:hypothetical protein
LCLWASRHISACRQGFTWACRRRAIPASQTSERLPECHREHSVTTQTISAGKPRSVGEHTLKRCAQRKTPGWFLDSPPALRDCPCTHRTFDHSSVDLSLLIPYTPQDSAVPCFTQEAWPSAESLQLREPGTQVLGVNPQRPALGRASPARIRQLTR